MSNLHVTYQDLRNAATQLTSGQGDIENRLMELKAYIDNLVSEGFVTSASSGAFQEQFTNFTTGAKQTISALEGLSSFLNSAAQALESTDNELAAQIRG